MRQIRWKPQVYKCKSPLLLTVSSVDCCVVSRCALELHRRARKVNKREHKLSLFVGDATLADIGLTHCLYGPQQKQMKTTIKAMISSMKPVDLCCSKYFILPQVWVKFKLKSILILNIHIWLIYWKPEVTVIYNEYFVAFSLRTRLHPHVKCLLPYHLSS